MSRKFKHDGGSKASRKKSLVLMASILLTLAIGVGGTLAYLATQTEPVPNTFTPAHSEIEIEETPTDTTKENIGVTNKSDYAVYVRMQIVETWKDSEGKIIAKPEGVSVTGYNDLNTNWQKGADGYYYYLLPVQKDATVTAFDRLTIRRGEYKLDLEVMAQAIQAVPDEAVEEAWSNDKVTVDANNGSLSITNN